jgi:uncharacterized integral membrane protein
MLLMQGIKKVLITGRRRVRKTNRKTISVIIIVIIIIIIIIGENDNSATTLKYVGGVANKLY